jgi:hypothetical protein
MRHGYRCALSFIYADLIPPVEKRARNVKAKWFSNNIRCLCLKKIIKIFTQFFVRRKTMPIFCILQTVFWFYVIISTIYSLLRFATGFTFCKFFLDSKKNA